MKGLTRDEWAEKLAIIGTFLQSKGRDVLTEPHNLPELSSLHFPPTAPQSDVHKRDEQL